MSAPRLMPALIAGAVTALVLILRRAATRSRAQRPGAGTARPPWRRAAAPRHPAPRRSPPPRPDAQADALLREAEAHVHQHWERLRAQHPPFD
ncbi:hypothetical protein ACLGIH_33005 [Streptomyces sp. HMX87]|uniref:hypothetical protein n=1 Tax=Streptomyces sp. HMX87 TaxID=3390849 RepID=UPI003A88517B